MTIIKNLIIGLAVLVIGLAGIGMLLPSEFRVERSIMIQAPASDIYPHIADLREWRKWGVWFQRDPNMQVEYSGEVGEVGMKSAWQSQQEGSGEMQLLHVVPDQNLRYSLYFPEFDMGSTGEFMLKDKGGTTQVVWADYGDVGNNPMNRYFALFMDDLIGPDFEGGLKNLKGLVEGI